MANDHYISRFLTKPWEVGKRQLWFYDFATDSFGRKSSESLFAADGLHSKATGDRFNELIESPVSQHRAKIGDGILVPPDKDWKLFRALVALIRLQPQRHIDWEGAADRKFTLDDLLAQGEGFLDGLAVRTQQDYVLIGGTLRHGAYQMCFTEGVYFPIPGAGEPIMAIPITPGHFIALPPKGYQKSDLEQWLAMEHSMSAFSIGLGGKANKVIVPPGLQPLINEDPAGLRKMLRTLRRSCREIFNTIGDANAALGLPSFKYTGHDDIDDDKDDE